MSKPDKSNIPVRVTRSTTRATQETGHPTGTVEVTLMTGGTTLPTATSGEPIIRAAEEQPETQKSSSMTSTGPDASTKKAAQRSTASDRSSAAPTAGHATSEQRVPTARTHRSLPSTTPNVGSVRAQATRARATAVIEEEREELRALSSIEDLYGDEAPASSRTRTTSDNVTASAGSAPAGESPEAEDEAFVKVEPVEPTPGPLDDLLSSAYRALYDVADETDAQIQHWLEDGDNMRSAARSRMRRIERTLAELTERIGPNHRAQSAPAQREERHSVPASVSQHSVPAPGSQHRTVRMEVPPSSLSQEARLRAAGLGPAGRQAAAPGPPGGGDDDDPDDDPYGDVPGPAPPPPPPRPPQMPLPDEPSRRPVSGVNPRYLREQVLPSASRGVQPSVLTQPANTVVYTEAAFQWIRDCIAESVGEPLELLPQIRSVKVMQPAAYQGQDNTDDFEEWLLNVLRWLRVTRITGPDLDVERVQLLGLILSGLALDWYNQEVASPYRLVRNWAFEDIVCALYKRFIHQATAQTATEKFEAVKFDAKVGTAAYFGELRKYASRMVAHPDAYTFRRRFINGLPRSIVTELTRGRGLSAENSTIDELLHEAIAIENALQYLDAYDRVARAAPKTTTHDSSITTASSAPTLLMRPRRMMPRLRLRNNNRPVIGTTAGQSAPRPLTQPQYRPGAGQSGVARASFPSRLPSASRGPGNDKGKQVDMSKVMCYACNGVGHYASDPSCPKSTSGRGASVRRMEESAMGEANEAGEDAMDVDEDPAIAQSAEAGGGDPPVDGSQYEPQDDYALDAYEDYEYDEGYYDGDEDEPQGYLRSFRIEQHDENPTGRRVFKWLDDELELVGVGAIEAHSDNLDVEPPLPSHWQFEEQDSDNPFQPDLTSGSVDEVYNSLPPPQFLAAV